MVEDEKAIGILTERDLLRSAAARLDPADEKVGLWMTAHPDTLGPEEEVGAAWASLSSHHYRHLPVVDGGVLVGVVSIRDLFAIASLRPADEVAHDVPRGSKGSSCSETTVGDVRGLEGFFHYRQYSAVELAEKRSLEDVWFLLFNGALPGCRRSRPASAGTWRAPRAFRRGSRRCSLPSPAGATRSTSCAPACRSSGPSWVRSHHRHRCRRP